MATIGNIINEIMTETKIIITQEYYNQMIEDCIKSTNDADKVLFHKRSLSGGLCACGAQWVKEIKKSMFADYTKYIPGCQCYRLTEENKQRIEMSRNILRYAELPAEYIGMKFKSLDLVSIHADTKTAFEKIKHYIDIKLYQKNIGLLLLGEIGCGKTLGGSLAFSYLLLKEDKKGKFISMPDLINKIKRSNYELDSELLNYDVIMFDDLDKLKDLKNDNLNWCARIVFSLFDKLINNGKIIICTSNVKKPSDLISFLDAAVVSRIIGATELVNFSGYDYRPIKKNLKIKNNS